MKTQREAYRQTDIKGTHTHIVILEKVQFRKRKEAIPNGMVEIVSGCETLIFIILTSSQSKSRK